MSRAGRFVGLFLDMLAAERGAAQNTLQAYRRDIEDYAAYLAAKRIEPAEAEPAAVRTYVASLEQRGLRASSAARRLSAVRQFHKFLYVEGYAPADPTAAGHDHLRLLDRRRRRRGLDAVDDLHLRQSELAIDRDRLH